MLDIIRKNVRHPWIQAMLGVVIVVFILFFGYSMKSDRPQYPAKVNGDAIDYRAYQQVYEGLMRVYQEALGPQATPERLRELGVSRRALDQLIDQALLAQEAKRRKLKVADGELQAAIQSLSLFQDGGQFVKDRYLKVLEANRLTPLEFEQQKRQEILLGKVEQAIRAEAKVTDDDVRKEYEDRNTKLDLEFAAFDPEELKKSLQPVEKDLRAYYEAEKESFRIPERRVARYVRFGPEAYVGAVTATDQELAQELAAGPSQEAEKEAVRARHILVKLAPDAKPEEAAKVRKKAEDIRNEALKAKDFGALAKKYSEDPGSKDKGGDLGYFERGQMVPEFEDAAFALKAGEVSELVKTSYGFHILRVEDHRKGGTRTLEELRPRLEAAVKVRKALEAADKAAEQVLFALEDKKETWAGLASKHEVQTTPPLPKAAQVQGLPRPGEFLDHVFSLGPDAPGKLLTTEQGTYLIGVEKILPAAIPPFEEVRAQVEGRYREAEAKKAAEKSAADFLVAAKKDGWEVALKAAGVKAERTGVFAKKGGTPPAAGWSPELRDAASALKTVGALGEKPLTVGGRVVAYRLAALTPADPAGFDLQKEKLRAELLPTKQSEHLQEFLKELKAKAEITINEELLL